MKPFSSELISWEVARKKMLDVEGQAKEFARLLPKEGLPDVWRVSYGFGFPVITHGRINIPPTEGKFLSDLRYQIKGEDPFLGDPLGLVLKGTVEIYTHSNVSFGSEKKKEIPLRDWLPLADDSHRNRTRILLNVLHPGDLFGVFGTVDTLMGQRPSVTLDWHASAGRACLVLIGPPAIIQQYDTPSNGGKGYPWIRAYTVPSEHVHAGAKKFESLLMEIRGAMNCECEPIEVLLFPKKWIEVLSKSKDARLRLHEIYWKQTFPLRNAPFEDQTIADALSEILGETVLEDDDTSRRIIESFCSHLIKATRGDSPVLRFDKLSPYAKTINENLIRIAMNCGLYLRVAEYGLLTESNDWGISSPRLAPLMLTSRLNPDSLKTEWYQFVEKVLESKCGKNTFEIYSRSSKQFRNPEQLLSTIAVEPAGELAEKINRVIPARNRLSVDMKNILVSSFVRVKRR